MKKRVFFLLIFKVLCLSLLGNALSSTCRFEDGFYESKARKYINKKSKEYTQHQLIVEVEGCLLKQVVSIDGKNTSNVKFLPLLLDDSGIVEVKIGEELYVVTIGFEINL